MDQEESSIGESSQQQSMQLVQRQDQYLSQRGHAIESIESTIHELGSIFQQLAQMVSEQAETVHRYILPERPNKLELTPIQMISLQMLVVHRGSY